MSLFDTKRSNRLSAVVLVVSASMAGSGFVVAEDADVEEMEYVEVIGITPTHGVGLAKDRIPANIQTATDLDMERSQSLDLTDFMNRNLGSVNINSAQNNPLQPDVQFRGFTASPLLGVPQGLAVYMNGMRINEAFGDTVNWDLIPKSAISSINLIGGANPIYGLNTLGGALSIQTKNGFTHEGNNADISYGSFERIQSSVSSGGNNGTWGYFATVSYFEEDGWRDHSESDALNLFGTLSWRGQDSTLDLNLSHGDTELVGNGSAPVELLAIDRAQAFTHPDITENYMNLIDLEGTHWMSDDTQLSGNIFYRWNDSDSFNGDGTAYVGCDDGLLYQEDDIDTTAVGDPDECDGAADRAGATPISDQFGNTIADSNDAINNISQRKQRTYGGSLQYTFLQNLFERDNQLIVGLAYHKGEAEFSSRVEASVLQPNRGTNRTGLFVTADRNDMDTSTRTMSVYFTDTVGLTDTVDLTFAGRYNATKVRVNDRVDPAGPLNGEHDYERFNPSVGLTWQASEGINVFGNYSESSRAPTPVELSCADPNEECTLPNAFLADPPLNQVVTKSIEGGLRGNYADMIDWNFGIFHTVNNDDIIFQSTGGTTGNTGFFDNIGDTKRVGVELGLNGDYDNVSWFMNYSFVHATFDDSLTVASPNHPLQNAAGSIAVESGDRIPGIPEHTLKLGADYAFNDAISFGADMTANSDQYLRGDEANLLDTVDGYVVVNLHGRYQINDTFSIFARIDNVFDTDYETFGLLGEPDEVFASFTDPRFMGAGAPIGGWVGIKASF